LAVEKGEKCKNKESRGRKKKTGSERYAVTRTQKESGSGWKEENPWWTINRLKKKEVDPSERKFRNLHEKKA